jgi:hypothetical protein
VASTSASAAPAAQAPADPDPQGSWVDPARESEPAPEKKSPGVDPKNYKIALSGNILIGLGVGGFILMATGFLLASDARDRLGYARAKAEPDEDVVAKHEGRLRTGNILGITGAAAAGAFLITGITLTALGRSRERKRREALEEQSLAPIFGPGMAGLSWSARF